MTAIVIDAGPAGLATAAQLTRDNIDVTVLEAAHAVGASWRARYDGLCCSPEREIGVLSYGRASADN